MHEDTFGKPELTPPEHHFLLRSPSRTTLRPSAADGQERSGQRSSCAGSRPAPASTRSIAGADPWPGVLCCGPQETPPEKRVVQERGTSQRLRCVRRSPLLLGGQRESELWRVLDSIQTRTVASAAARCVAHGGALCSDGASARWPGVLLAALPGRPWCVREA